MRHLRLRGLCAATLALCATVGLLAANRAEEPKALALFDGKDLKGWYAFLNHNDNSEPGSDPKGVFKVEDGILHVSGEEFGCLTTKQEFENYRLTLEFKWGEKRYPPREAAVRDSGVLLHCVGPDKVWPKSIECQIQEHDCGDFFPVGGTELTIDGKRVKDRGVKTSDHEKPLGEWNTIEVICDGSTIVNKVNGVEVNRGTDASVSRGKITLQSEGAEIFFRKVELTPLR